MMVIMEDTYTKRWSGEMALVDFIHSSTEPATKTRNSNSQQTPTANDIAHHLQHRQGRLQDQADLPRHVEEHGGSCGPMVAGFL